MPNRTPNLVLRIAAAKQATVRSCRATRLQRRRAELTCRGQSAVRGVVIRELRPINGIYQSGDDFYSTVKELSTQSSLA
ncbi:hypothetical protein GQ600_761 [Phytophthora cactorum]|nr:hypothetical protein GQ600_761 [Phytophthora cactorum]